MKHVFDRIVDWAFGVVEGLLLRAWHALRSAFAALLLIGLPFGLVWAVNLCPHIDTSAGQYEGLKVLGLLGFGFFMVWKTRVLETFVKAAS